MLAIKTSLTDIDQKTLANLNQKKYSLSTSTKKIIQINAVEKNLVDVGKKIASIDVGQKIVSADQN